MPCLAMLSVSFPTAGSAILPPETFFLPMCISPFRNVPAVNTMLFAYISVPHNVLIPNTLLSLSTIISSAWSCQMSRLSVLSSIFLHSQIYFSLSHCALGLHIAGPFDMFSNLNCIEVLSVTIPMNPPRASISLTICPLAMPPTAGLQDICAILFMSIVTRHVFAPILAEAVAASHPACPPPITITS